jgi:hypothetical protein
LYVATCNLLELEVLGDIGRDKDVCKLAVGHEQLWYEIDVPVVYAAVLLPWLAGGLPVSFEELQVV